MCRERATPLACRLGAKLSAKETGGSPDPLKNSPGKIISGLGRIGKNTVNKIAPGVISIRAVK